MAETNNQVGIDIVWTEDGGSINVNTPSILIKQHGFIGNETTFLVKLVLATPSKRPPDDPNGWKDSDNKKPEQAIVTISKESTDTIYYCEKVTLKNCRILSGKNEEENCIEFEMVIG